MKKKLIFNISLLSFASLPLFTTVAASCNSKKEGSDTNINEEVKNYSVKANEKGLGYFPETIKKLIKNKTNKELIDKINEFVAKDQQISYDSNKTYLFNEDKSTFELDDYDSKYNCIISISEKDAKSLKVHNITIDNIGYNNLEHDEHEFSKLEKVYFWDGQLIIDGYINDPEIKKKVSAADLYEKISDKTFEEQIQIIRDMCKINVEFKPDDNYDYYSDVATHTHEKSLHYTFSRSKKGVFKLEKVSRDIQGFEIISKEWVGIYASGGQRILNEDVEDQSENHNWTGQDVKLGSFTIKPVANDEGKKISSNKFNELLKKHDEEKNHEPEEIIKFIKKYINIQGEFKSDDIYEYAFNVKTSHTHGTSNFHFYAYYREKGKNQKWKEASVVVNGWNSQ
ncbi:hypothetical protein NPA07_03645 [Mycoplasmopsis caviae]|uniref:Lipoprotein n=1 Tax=Mycoplasmopsis caviae TaxID=55603 RepID=A0A3P8KCL4_9BACT|nr:hypothetical protein [Mycoplasmopsis caviae]UUD34878.1 hypothetical protein NPA07_03645 [Mycoplasmopsis caviae]VDR42274.1 Uncharacterised protein [Mycoplasmopsis caviae]